MAGLVERLKDIEARLDAPREQRTARNGSPLPRTATQMMFERDELRADLRTALAALPVCAAVEAFQAAEQAYAEACDLIIDDADPQPRERATTCAQSVEAVRRALLAMDLR